MLYLKKILSSKKNLTRGVSYLILYTLTAKKNLIISLCYSTAIAKKIHKKKWSARRLAVVILSTLGGTSGSSGM